MKLSIVCWDGEQRWNQNNDLHREIDPAIIRTDGSTGWYIEGEAIAHDTIELGFIMCRGREEGYDLQNRRRHHRRI